MELVKKLKNGWYKIMARQLRQPSGALANITGNKMNKSNELLYHLTLNNLNLKDNESVLEIGFGNGKFFPALYAKAKNLSITGIDHSQQMVAEAIIRNKDLYNSGAIKLSVGTSESLAFIDDSFDTIFSVNVIYFWENPEAHLKEIHRVLKPGGYFCTGFRPKENLEKFPFTNFGFRLYKSDEWKNLLEENGFQFMSLQNGKELEIKMKQENTPFESLCMVSTKSNL